jgi:hypothetical protein
MKSLTSISEIHNTNTAESIFGDIQVFGNSIVIPYFNVHIIPNQSHENLEKGKAQYVQFCYLVFEGVVAVSWDYDDSRLIDSDNRECYGGIYYYDNNYYEFWIKYRYGKILVAQDYAVSLIPWEKSRIIQSFFEENRTSDIKEFLLKNLR